MPAPARSARRRLPRRRLGSIMCNAERALRREFDGAKCDEYVAGNAYGGQWDLREEYGLNDGFTRSQLRRSISPRIFTNSVAAWSPDLKYMAIMPLVLLSAQAHTPIGTFSASLASPHFATPPSGPGWT